MQTHAQCIRPGNECEKFNYREIHELKKGWTSHRKLWGDFGCHAPGCIPCKTDAGGTPVTPQVYAKVEGRCTPEVQRSKEPCIDICILLRQCAKEYSLGNIQAVTPTGKVTPHRRSSGLSTRNASWATP